MRFDPDARFFALSHWHKIQICDKFSSVIFICVTFDSIFSIIVWTDRLHDFDEEYVSLTTAAMKMGKKYFYNDHSNGC